MTEKAKTSKKTKTTTSTNVKRKKKKQNLLKLYSEMNKLSIDAVDKEVIKRFKIIIDTCEEDITKTSLITILKDTKNVEINTFHESFQPYIKHYIFLLKRSLRKK